VELIEALCADPERPWATFNHGKAMTQRQLSTRLRSFGIVSSSVRFQGGTLRGYKLEQFAEVFGRYIPSSSHIQGFETEQQHIATATGDSGDFSIRNTEVCSDLENAPEAPSNKGCAAVPDRNPQSVREHADQEKDNPERQPGDDEGDDEIGAT
jgi:Protein of unknown function (DUF3631)